MSVEVITFGCRLNYYESMLIKKLITKVELQDDIVIINSCIVTQEAERKLRQAIRHTKRKNPHKLIILVGCATHINADSYKQMPEIFCIIDNKQKLDIQTYHKIKQQLEENAIKEGKENAKDKVEAKITSDSQNRQEYFVDKFPDRTRAFLRIQTGCNHNCTFCIIPQARGKSISTSPDSIIKQASILTQNGHNEIVLTGVDITAYGVDFNCSQTHSSQSHPSQKTHSQKMSLGLLIKRILHEVPNLQRLRLSSIDVAEIDDDLIEVIANEKRLMPHLHLSLQSGDDTILKLMRRRHTANMAWKCCEAIRKLRPDIAFGADIIVGFPTETDAMFQNTCDLVRNLNIVHLHVFPYSERQNTLAAQMIPRVPKQIRAERGKILRNIGHQLLQTHHLSMVGRQYQAILESEGIVRTENFTIAKLIAPPKKLDQLGNIEQQNNSTKQNYNENCSNNSQDCNKQSHNSQNRIGDIIQVKITQLQDNTLLAQPL
jgi:threonylcarbamoyladenosine tRNA methylthiotransferase MtaB